MLTVFLDFTGKTWSWLGLLVFSKLLCLWLRAVHLEIVKQQTTVCACMHYWFQNLIEIFFLGNQVTSLILLNTEIDISWNKGHKLNKGGRKSSVFCQIEHSPIVQNIYKTLGNSEKMEQCSCALFYFKLNTVKYLITCISQTAQDFLLVLLIIKAAFHIPRTAWGVCSVWEQTAWRNGWRFSCSKSQGIPEHNPLPRTTTRWLEFPTWISDRTETGSHWWGRGVPCLPWTSYWRLRVATFLQWSPSSAVGLWSTVLQLRDQWCQRHPGPQWPGSCSDSTEGCLQSGNRKKMPRRFPAALGSSRTFPTSVSDTKLLNCTDRQGRHQILEEKENCKHLWQRVNRAFS